MVSRLPSYLHPVAGRPLVWHTISALMSPSEAARHVLVLTPPDFPAEVFGEGPEQVDIRPLDPDSTELRDLIGGFSSPLLMAHGSASLDPADLARLADAEVGSWIDGGGGEAAAAYLSPDQLLGLLQLDTVLSAPGELLDPGLSLEVRAETFIVRNRRDLARLQHRIRDQLVHTLMDNGATFLLPDSVQVDVDVRIGRDTVIYPSVVIEGQTTIGEETVIGPGCRIIDSWIGSGVEMKGWNYVAHTSVRNRAILEPYVRRGFD